jgi:uncharacterized protein (TIGR00288 family)
MNVPYTRAPHQGTVGMAAADATHAALLIDFDNVTMGMRSDLSKELKSLLDTDVIKGKVSVQRAYADWRRYPQYIVPLSEASVDLIFAPAYGSNKKNATDIRMAIDALELVFIRPEIGTYILLTGDSDFSSLVLKLKEYGKYVIGVGIQESSSDILVQNCDEYYSYTSLTGLTKTTDLKRDGRDPWVLVRDSVAKMVQRGDVMRSDRLKQVMQELDPTFDEGAIGFSKFSKFISEASSRGLVSLRKLENGQYEIDPGSGRGSRTSDEGRGRGGRSRGGRGRGRSSRGGESRDRTTTTDESTAGDSPETGSDAGTDTDPLRTAYATLREALSALRDAGRHPVRDSDVKRKMLERHRNFDEGELGFPKFRSFLDQAAEQGLITLQVTEAGTLEVSLDDETATPPTGTAEAARHEHDSESGDAQATASGADTSRSTDRGATESGATDSGSTDTGSGDTGSGTAGSSDAATESKEADPGVTDGEPPQRSLFGFRLGPRRGATRRRGPEDVASLFGFGNAPAVEPAATTPSPSDGDSASGGTGVAATEMSAAEEALTDALDDDDLGLGVEEVEYDDSVDYGTEDDEAPEAPATSSPAASRASAAASDSSGEQESRTGVDGLGLPSEPGAIVRYLTHRYKGVGEKTAETLVDQLGADIFRTMHENPDAIAQIVPPGRADQVLEAWRSDYERRTSASRSSGSGSGGGSSRRGDGRGRSRGRGRS